MYRYVGTRWKKHARYVYSGNGLRFWSPIISARGRLQGTYLRGQDTREVGGLSWVRYMYIFVVKYIKVHIVAVSYIATAAIPGGLGPWRLQEVVYLEFLRGLRHQSFRLEEPLVRLARE